MANNIDTGLLGGLAEGLKAGYGAYNDQMERKRRIAQYEADQKMKKTMMDLDIMKSGSKVDENGGLIVDPNSPHWLEKQGDINLKAAEHGMIADPNAPSAGILPTSFISTPDQTKKEQTESSLKEAQTKNYIAEAKKNEALAAAGGSAGGNPVKRLTELEKNINPNKMRSGNLGKSQAMINAADRIDGLFKQFPDYNIPKAQTMELATATAAMVNGGSAQSQHQIDSIVPSSLKGDAQGIASWLSNDPKGNGQQEFMHLMHETAKRERAVAENQVKSAQVAAASSYADLKDNPRFKQIMKAYRIDPDTEIDANWQYAPANTAPPGNGGGLIGKPAISFEDWKKMKGHQ